MPSESYLGCDVVIVNYNAGKLLADCVLSALTANVTHIIIVDNDSTDDSLSYLRAIKSEQISLLANDKNLGFAAGCNIGYARAKSDFILFLNPDCHLDENAVATLIKVLQSSPTIGMVGGLLTNPDGSEQQGGRRAIPTPWRSFVRAFGLHHLAQYYPNLFFDFHLHKQALPSHPIEVEAISGACMLVKREAIDKVGLWDEGYFLHCEDLDWCMRFRQNGWKILFVPDAKITHALGACSQSRKIFVEWHKHKGMIRFYHKFFKQQYPGPLMTLVIIGVSLRFLLVAGYVSGQHLLNTLKNSLK
ncbi:MAG: glycosyltransferase family 2 protein [Methylococcaceae bacterium]|nr:glycosyltransferase family 2 protein [Methylococcaceae bacterium]